MTSTQSVETGDAPSLVTVACVNFAAASGPDGSTSKAARLEKMLRQTREAHRQGAQLVVFPESAVGSVGPDCEECSVESGPCLAHQQCAETVPGPSSQALAELAAELDVYIVFGIDEADHDDPTRLYNSAVLVGPEGFVGTYRKLHLGHPLETKRFAPGDALPVFQTALGPG